MGLLDDLINARFYAVEGVVQARRQTVDFIGATVVHDATTDTMRLTFSGAVPVGTTVGQTLVWSGTAWAANDNVTMPSGGTRTISVLQPATGNGNILRVHAGNGAGGNDDGGDLQLYAGTKTGSGTSGSLKLTTPGGGTAVIEIGPNGELGFFAKSPLVAAPPTIDALTDLTGGSVGDTLLSSASQAVTDDNFATLNAKVEALRAALVANGLLQEGA